MMVMERMACAAVGVTFAALVVSAMTASCSGEPGTNFGPPDGLTGKTLPPPEDSGSDAKGMADANPTKKCMKTAPDDAAASEGGGGSDSGSTDAAATDSPADAASSDAPPADDAAADGGSSGGDAGGCSVSFTRDIFPNMKAGGAWQCASASCHASGVNTPMLTDDAAQIYNALSTFKLLPPAPDLPYILPCVTDEKKSAFVCNITTANCGIQMPLTTGGATVPTTHQIAQIKTWVACGAEFN